MPSKAYAGVRIIFPPINCPASRIVQHLAPSISHLRSEADLAVQPPLRPNVVVLRSPVGSLKMARPPARNSRGNLPLVPMKPDRPEIGARLDHLCIRSGDPQALATFF